MRVGSLVYATDQGLGVLAKEFYDHGVVTDALVIQHQSHPTHTDWYPFMNVRLVTNLRSQREKLEQFCRAMDVMLFFESPFDWTIPSYCRSIGVKTAICVMYECYLERFLDMNWDLVICPSLLDLRYFPNQQDPTGLTTSGRRSVYLPVPVGVSWRQRTRAEVFVHNAGHLGMRGRNGTRELYTALQYVKSPVKMILRTQERFNEAPNLSQEIRVGNVLVDYRYGTYPRETLWEEGDVFVFPEKFNGLSLPLQEARAAGMLVMATDRFPINEWLPKEVRTGFSTVSFQEDQRDPLVPLSGTVRQVDEQLNPLIPVQSYRRARVGPPYLEFDEAVIDPRTIATKIDEWYSRDITSYSSSAREWAETMSWDALKPRYIELLEGLL